MMTPKEALIQDGTIPTTMGRGRLSVAQDARCRELAAQGWNIKGYVVSAPVKGDTISPAAPVVKKTVAATEKTVLDYTLTYPEKDWTAVDKDGKVVGMREVCNNCRVSLVQCHCDNPIILGDTMVTIRPRK